jgi:hypothetical protein
VTARRNVYIFATRVCARCECVGDVVCERVCGVVVWCGVVWCWVCERCAWSVCICMLCVRVFVCACCACALCVCMCVCACVFALCDTKRTHHTNTQHTTHKHTHNTPNTQAHMCGVWVVCVHLYVSVSMT